MIEMKIKYDADHEITWIIDKDFPENKICITELERLKLKTKGIKL